MKSIMICFIAGLGFLSCTETQSDLQDHRDDVVSARSGATTVYFYDDLGANLTYDTVLGEHDVIIDEDFEFKLYGTSGWTPYDAPLRIKIKCKCNNEFSAAGNCNPFVDAPTGNEVSVDCREPCAAACKMKVRIRSIAGEPVSEFDFGGDFRLQ